MHLFPASSPTNNVRLLFGISFPSDRRKGECTVAKNQPSLPSVASANSIFDFRASLRQWSAADLLCTPNALFSSTRALSLTCQAHQGLRRPGSLWWVAGHSLPRVTSRAVCLCVCLFWLSHGLGKKHLSKLSHNASLSWECAEKPQWPSQPSMQHWGLVLCPPWDLISEKLMEQSEAHAWKLCHPLCGI